MHLQVTAAFEASHGRSYIGSRDIDLGVHVDPEWDRAALRAAAVSTTLDRVESELGYDRGRFGFFQQFHRETGDRLDADDARALPPHDIFRVDIDVIPDTTELDTFEDTFGFRPPAEPLLAPVFADDEGAVLDDHVSWTAPADVLIAPPSALAAMKVRAFPERDKSHKRLKDLADLHALLWYCGDYAEQRSAVLERVSADDVETFQTAIATELYDQVADLVGVDRVTVRQSIERLYR